MTSPKPTTVVVLFVRIPIPGRVKTRLAKDLGATRACELYKAIVADVLRSIKSAGLPLYLFCDRENDGNLPREWTDVSDSVVVQQGASIGDRMAAAFRYCFNEQIDKVILIGSDIPGIDAYVLLTAEKKLESCDITIAPAADGGYCLIAMKQNSFLPEIFNDIPWSTDAVLRNTFEICEKHDISIELLACLQDIDTIEDFDSYRLIPSATAYATNMWIENGGCLRVSTQSSGPDSGTELPQRGAVL